MPRKLLDGEQPAWQAHLPGSIGFEALPVTMMLPLLPAAMPAEAHEDRGIKSGSCYMRLFPDSHRIIVDIHLEVFASR